MHRFLFYFIIQSLWFILICLSFLGQAQVLLSTLYIPSSQKKLRGITHVLEKNLEIFTEIHLLVQEDYSKEAWAEHFPIVSHESIHLVHVAAPEFHRNMAWQQWNSSAYLYQDYFKYANDHLSNRLVVLSNNDIEFPDYAPDMLVDLWQPDTGLVITRREAPCGKKQAHPNFCHVKGHEERPFSFDVFVFKPPLLQAVIDQTNFPQNIKGAENTANWVLSNIGKLEMYNVCEYVDIWHHHCERNMTEWAQIPQLCSLFGKCVCPPKLQIETVRKRGGEKYHT